MFYGCPFRLCIRRAVTATFRFARIKATNRGFANGKDGWCGRGELNRVYQFRHDRMFLLEHIIKLFLFQDFSVTIKKMIVYNSGLRRKKWKKSLVFCSARQFCL